MLRTKLPAAGCVALVGAGAALVAIDPGEHGSSSTPLKAVGSVGPVTAAPTAASPAAAAEQHRPVAAPPARASTPRHSRLHPAVNVGTPQPAQTVASSVGATGGSGPSTESPGTNIATITPRTTCAPATDAPASSTTTSASASPPPAPTTNDPSSSSSGRGGQGMWIRIPAIHVNAPVVTVGVNSDHSIAVPPLDKPYETAWYDGSARPGHVGTSVILGHIDSAATGAAVFYYLDKLRPGNLVTITLPHAGRVRYRVDGLREYHKTTLPYARVFGPVSYPGLRLITCGGAFDCQTGHYVDNIVVYASMVS